MLCSSFVSLVVSAQSFENKSGGSIYIHSLKELIEPLTAKPKLDTVVKYIKDHLAIDDTYKVVVFSTYLESLWDIVRTLEDENVRAVGYTGMMNAKEKEAAKVDFQTNPDTRVFVSSDAGGYGVDLPQANLLINYDQPWSSGLAVQRNGRINRASSTWPSITIQDFLVEGSIEQRQYDTLRQKSNIAGAILDGEGINAKGGVDLTVGSMIDFLTAKLI
jgi:ERCC4-related helicase